MSEGRSDDLFQVAHDLMDLGFRVRTVNVLTRVRNASNRPVLPITTLDQLASCSLRDILCRRGAGRKTLADCAVVLLTHRYDSRNSKFLAEWIKETYQ